MNKSFDEVWEKIHENKVWGSYPNENIIRFVARNYYNCSNRRDVCILDFGCGAGSNTWYLAREGFSAYAFDGAKSAVERTKEKLRKEALSANVICSDAFELPYDNNFFDAIIDCASILTNCTENILAMYNICYKLLKSNGKLISIVYGKETDGYGTGIQLEEGTFENLTEGRLQHIGKKHFFAKEELENILNNTGFYDIVIDTHDYTDGGIRIQQYIATCKK